jgi:hypothetical protein
MRKVWEIRDKISLTKVIKILSKCKLDKNKELKIWIVETLKSGGKLNGLPLNSEFFLDHAFPMILQLREDF